MVQGVVVVAQGKAARLVGLAILPQQALLLADEEPRFVVLEVAEGLRRAGFAELSAAVPHENRAWPLYVAPLCTHFSVACFGLKHHDYFCCCW